MKLTSIPQVYLPVYFQACKDASPTRSGINLFPYSFSIAPAAIIAGAVASINGRYWWSNFGAWCLIMIGMGLQSTLRPNSSTGHWVGYELIAGAGYGLLVWL
jgi:hypothetical protein